jgi:Flp pilus assembly protein TadG
VNPLLGKSVRRGRGDGGTGMLTAALALLLFLVFLLFAVQLLVNLYDSSVVTGAAYDGARVVASHTVDHSDPTQVERAEDRAEQKMRSRLGPQGQRASFDWSGSDADQIAVRVQLDTPRFSLGGFGRSIPFNHIDRTAHVRVEVLR